jgi:L-asparaginase
MTTAKRKILLIYTGGTIGMITDSASGALKPFDFEQITLEVPELNKLDCEIKTFSFEKPIDSSNVTPEIWIKLVKIIANHYNDFDGFVILHGSDTMAYTASALSFMIKNLDKPIVFTGSQLPIGIIRTDGKENLITAIEVAAACDKDNQPLVPEVAVYFEYKLYRANRTTKLSAEHFNAFASFNYPKLAEAGISIDYNLSAVRQPTTKEVEFITNIDINVGVLKVFPGISPVYVEHFFRTPGLRGVILETFGAGNASSSPLFLSEIKQALEKGIVIVNVTQCKSGRVNQQKYETGRGLEDAGVIGGNDITFEAAITKLMVVLGNFTKAQDVKRNFQQPWSGELTIS